MELLARTRIVLWEGAALWLVDATVAAGETPRRTDPHAHHAIQVTLSLGGWFGLTTGDIEIRDDAAVVAADAEHVFEAEGLIAFIFIEPESRAGRSVSRTFLNGADLVALPPACLGAFREDLAAAYRAPVRDDVALVGLGRRLVSTLAGNVIGDEPDPRISTLIDWAAKNIDGPISLSDAVALSDLSVSRLRHLFVEQTGLPFKSFLLWLRLMRALQARACGASITEAAHEAGFSDSAHLSRTFRRMFGIAPAALRMA